eukprot:2424864-Alexandrium_andersonii.AAC.1
MLKHTSRPPKRKPHSTKRERKTQPKRNSADLRPCRTRQLVSGVWSLTCAGPGTASPLVPEAPSSYALCRFPRRCHIHQRKM